MKISAFYKSQKIRSKFTNYSLNTNCDLIKIIILSF